MLYEINKNYYILIGRKYIKVDFKVRNKDVDIVVPDNNVYIEKNDSLNVREHNFDEKFKENIIKANNNRYSYKQETQE